MQEVQYPSWYRKSAWNVGFRVSHNHTELMGRLFIILSESKIEWDFCGKASEYKLELRMTRHFGRKTSGGGILQSPTTRDSKDVTVTALLSIYSELLDVGESSSCILDIQRISGDKFLFMDLCALVLSKLQR
eukprot:TRINITY_DN4626_c0_g1_i3.p1 TRINITY_DN4626_c0_g1~~TRINITY_DN4626_c0_g1_i3.p1  ORF type:complete len:132 (-),score=26.55 TRINITY_DN4626_c0_g1_i3:187-582(-)